MAGILAGKVAVVTGGGIGIGEAIARVFAREGCKVMVAGRRKDRLEKVASEIGGAAVVCDVTREEDVKALFGACDLIFGRLDVLVNNAGVTGPVLGAEDMDMRLWDETIAVNVRGLFLCTKHGIPLLKRQGGSIINMSSRMGLKGGVPMRSPYTASKFAVIGITQAVAFEVGVHGIRVNALCPGAVTGELMDRIVAERSKKEGRPPAEIAKSYTDVAALRKWVEPDEIAEAALFLASDAASAITAEHIVIDAGRM